MKKKVILDVDTGIDDAIGIILATTAPELDLLGITTVSGNIDLESATLNTLRVLKLLGKDEVQVYKGAETPLQRKIRYAVEIHGASGMAGQLEDVEVVHKQSKKAWEFYHEMASQYPGEVTLVMTGPQTNLAMALNQYPELKNLFKEVIVMGGAVKEKGNESPTAEFNIAIDPEAAEMVFQSGMNVTMIGLDVTKKSLLRREHFSALRKDSPVADFVMKVTNDYMERYFKANGIYGCSMHDPLAVTMTIAPQFVKTQHLFVGVETKSQYCDGQTVCDFENRWNKAPNVHVGLEVDVDGFTAFLIDRINAAPWAL